MPNRSFALVLLIAACFATSDAGAQNTPHPSPVKSRASAIHPDLSGVWFIDEYHRTILPKEDPPFQPWA